MYNSKRYSNTKKGKLWNDRKRNLSANSMYNTGNDFYSFIYNKAMELEDMMETGTSSLGLNFYPCLYMGNDNMDGYLRDYFDFKEDNHLKQSLNYIYNMPTVPFDMYIPHDSFALNEVMYNTGNVVEDVYNSIMYRYQIETSSGVISSEASLAFSFVYQFPNNLIPSRFFYGSMMCTILEQPGFRERTMFIRSDVLHNRILFIVSNLTNNAQDLKEYHDCYDSNIKYTKKSILFTKHPDTLFEGLDRALTAKYLEYKNSLITNYYIKKVKDK